MKMKRVQRIRLVLVMTLVMAFPAVASAQGTLFVEGNKVGVGVDTPTAPLHVQSTAGDAQILVEELSGTAAARTLYTLRNNGGIRFGMVNSTSGSIWQFSALANFNIDFNGNPGVELQVKQNGDVVIGGVLTQGSSKVLKNDLGDLDPEEVLERLQALPIQIWSYREDTDGSRHLGPYAEDFHRLFEVGDDKTIAPSDQAGVALIAIQGLHRQVQQKDQQISELAERLERIEKALAAGEDSP